MWHNYPFLYIFIIWLGCAHTDHFMRWITRQSCGSESVHLGMSWSNSEPALNRSLTELRLFVFPPQTWCFSAPLHCWAGVKHRFGSTYVRSWELGYYRYKFLSCLKQLTWQLNTIKWMQKKKKETEKLPGPRLWRSKERQLPGWNDETHC